MQFKSSGNKKNRNKSSLPLVTGRRMRIGVAHASRKSRLKKFLLMIGGFIIVMLLLLIIISLAPPVKPRTIESSPAPSSEATILPTSEAKSKVESITLANNRIDIDDALKAFASEYEASSGLTVKISTISGSADYNETLKVQLKAGNFPDIFVIEGPTGYALWQDKIADLSGEPWVKDTDFSYTDPSGKVAGFPVSIEGYGLACNRDLLAQAEIDPASLTNFAGTKAAFEKLDKMKKKLGIDAVIAMSVSSKNGMAWVSGQNNFNVYLSDGLSFGNTLVIDKLLKGEVEANRLAQYAEFVNLLFKYADPQILLNGSYDDQARAFAAGRTVFIQDSNWLDPTLASLGAKFDMAYVPLGAFLPPTAGVFIEPTSWYCVNRESPGGVEARKFLNAMAATESGQRYMVEAAGLVPAFKSVQMTSSQPLSKSIKAWADEGKVYSMMQDRLPSGFGVNTLGPIYEQLAAGTINTAQFTQQMTAAIQSLAPVQPQKGPTQPQKSPTQTQKSPTQTQKSPTQTQKSPTQTQVSPTTTQAKTP